MSITPRHKGKELDDLGAHSRAAASRRSEPAATSRFAVAGTGRCARAGAGEPVKNLL